MDYSEFIFEAGLVVQVAHEVVDEPDTVARHPDVVDAIASLAGRPGLNDLFGGNGHDPDAFVSALAEGLRPYTDEPLEDPEIIENIAVLAAALRPLLVEDAQAAHV